MFFRLLANDDSRIDLRRFMVELKSLNRYKNVLSLDTFFGFNVRKDKDFLVGAIFIVFFFNSKIHKVIYKLNCTSDWTKRKRTVYFLDVWNSYF